MAGSKRARLLAQVSVFAGVAALVGCGRVAKGAQDGPPAAPREFRGVWVASVANIDWPSRPTLSTAQQKVELLNILDRCRELRMNAVLLQVRPACDALYASRYEPWSEYLTGRMGKAPNPYYDPLEFAVAEAHKRGIELHAWFNPFRAHHSTGKSPISANHVSKAQPGIVRKYGKNLWLDPGAQAAQDYSMNVIMDVVRRYDVDGVHLDDYFYPYKERGPRGILPFPDDPTWKAYRASGGRLARDDWRRDNITAFGGIVHNGDKATSLYEMRLGERMQYG